MFELGKAATIEIAKFVHAEEEAFVVRNRRNRRLGIWLASQLPVIEDELDFANTVVALGVAARDDESLIRHIEAELSRRGLRVPQPAIRFELERQGLPAAALCTMVWPMTQVAHQA